MSLLAKREHVRAMKNDDAAKEHAAGLAQRVSEIACCQLHQAGLLNVAYTGMLRTLGFPTEFCLALIPLLDSAVADMMQAKEETEH